MRWKQTTPNVLVASGTAVSVRDHHHLTFLSFSSNSWSFSPGNPGDSSLISSWKCLTPASWNQLYREERAAVWLPSSDWQLSGLRLTCCWPRGVVFSCRISLCVFFFLSERRLAPGSQDVLLLKMEQLSFWWGRHGTPGGLCLPSLLSFIHCYVCDHVSNPVFTRVSCLLPLHTCPHVLCLPGSLGSSFCPQQSTEMMLSEEQLVQVQCPFLGHPPPLLLSNGWCCSCGCHTPLWSCFPSCLGRCFCTVCISGSRLSPLFPETPSDPQHLLSSLWGLSHPNGQAAGCIQIFPGCTVVSWSCSRRWTQCSLAVSIPLSRYYFRLSLLQAYRVILQPHLTLLTDIPHPWKPRPTLDSCFCFRGTYPVSWGFPGGSVVKNLPANAGDVRDMGLIPGSGRSSGGEHGYPLQYSCLENSMDRGACWATVHRVAKSYGLYSPWGCKESDRTEMT